MIIVIDNRHTPRYPHAAPRFVAFLVDPFVHGAPFGGKATFCPDLLDVDQGALARAEHEVLQRRNHD